MFVYYLLLNLLAEPNYHEDTRAILDGVVQLDKHHELFYTTKTEAASIKLSNF